MNDIPQWVVLLAPLVLLQLVLIVVGLRDLIGREKTRGPRWLCAVLIMFLGLIGPVAYFVFGREE